jgi:hypothetical protein
MIQNSKIKEAVLERLEREGIQPRSRLYWLSHEYAFWSAWGLSVLLGALSLAVLSFSSVYMGYSLYEATHDNFLTFLVDTLPFLWLIAAIFMVVASYFNIRHTKKGYKYPVILVIGSSLGFSVLGGLALHYIGAGYYLDRFLGEVSDSYQSRVEFEARLWQAPEFGRLVGQAVLPDEVGAIKGFLFTDIDDRSWPIIGSELGQRESELLRSGRKVKLLFATSSQTGEEMFVACGVFPWTLDEVPMIAELREERSEFVHRVEERRHRFNEIIEETKNERVEQRPENLPTSSVLAIKAVPVDNGPCGLLPLFRAR